jgi:hypothetical protein
MIGRLPHKDTKENFMEIWSSAGFEGCIGFVDVVRKERKFI